MRRALDAAKAKLDASSSRDAILDCFFEHGRDLFLFSVLFVIRGTTALGRNVHGLGAHDDLVTRIALPLTGEPGILTRARDLRRPFLTSGGVSEADSRLFGSIGRAMPVGLVVPLVLRDRVVGIFLGDIPAEPLQRRAAEIGRSAVELAKDEMLLWAEAVGNALEQLIMRRKGSGSVRPPGFGSVPPPAMGLDDPGLRFPPPAPLPSWGPDEDVPVEDGTLEEGMPLQEDPNADIVVAPAPARPLGLYLAGVGVVATAAALVGGGFYLWSTRAEANPDRVVTPGDKLAGWPRAVDPSAVLDAARAAAAPGVELASIQAEVGRDGRVDFSSRPKNLEVLYLTFVFVTPDAELNVRVDSDGMHAGRRRPRSICVDQPCRWPVPAPHCSFAQIREASVAAGLGADERSLFTYADRRENQPTAEAGPGWSVSVVDRGHIGFDAATCKPLPRSRLLPLALPLESVPGAPREVDPMNVLPLARTQSGLEPDAVLLLIEARGVGATGKVDASTDGAIAFTFADPPTEPAKSRRWREVQLDKSGLAIKVLNEGLPVPSRFAADVRVPSCSFAHAFKTLGAPPGSVGTIRYGRPAGAVESEFDVAVASTGRRAISDTECAAWERLVKK
jgi:hypothetical protein